MFDSLHKKVDEMRLQYFRAVDNALLTFLKEQKITTSRNPEQIKKDLKSKGFELSVEKVAKTNGTEYCFKLMRVVSKRKVLVRSPKIIIE